MFLPKSCAGSIRMPSRRTPSSTARSASAGDGRDDVGHHVVVRDPVRPGPRAQPAGVGADQPGAGRRRHLGQRRVGAGPGVVEQVGAGRDRLGGHLGPPGVDRDHQSGKRSRTAATVETVRRISSAASTSSPGPAFTPPMSMMSAPSATASPPPAARRPRRTSRPGRRTSRASGSRSPSPPARCGANAGRPSRSSPVAGSDPCPFDGSWGARFASMPTACHDRRHGYGAPRARRRAGRRGAGLRRRRRCSPATTPAWRRSSRTGGRCRCRTTGPLAESDLKTVRFDIDPARLPDGAGRPGAAAHGVRHRVQGRADRRARGRGRGPARRAGPRTPTLLRKAREARGQPAAGAAATSRRSRRRADDRTEPSRRARADAAGRGRAGRRAAQPAERRPDGGGRRARRGSRATERRRGEPSPVTSERPWLDDAAAQPGAGEVTATVIVGRAGRAGVRRLHRLGAAGRLDPVHPVRVVAGDGGEGSLIEAVTAVGPAVLRDEMRVDQVDPPYEVRVVHCGKVLRGPGRDAVHPAGRRPDPDGLARVVPAAGGVAGRVAWPVLWPGSKLSLTARCGGSPGWSRPATCRSRAVDGLSDAGAYGGRVTDLVIGDDGLARCAWGAQHAGVRRRTTTTSGAGRSATTTRCTSG